MPNPVGGPPGGDPMGGMFGPQGAGSPPSQMGEKHHGPSGMTKFFIGMGASPKEAKKMVEQVINFTTQFVRQRMKKADEAIKKMGQKIKQDG